MAVNKELARSFGRRKSSLRLPPVRLPRTPTEQAASVLAFLALISIVNDYLLPYIFPTVALIVDGRLAEATITELPPSADDASRGAPKLATIRFSARLSVGSLRNRYTITRITVAKVRLPEEIGPETRIGDKIIVTHHSTDPSVVRSGAVKLGWLSPKAVFMLVAAGVAAAILRWVIRRDRTDDAESKAVYYAYHSMICVFAALFCCVFLLVSYDELRWELGMRYDKKSAPSKFSNIQYTNGNLVGTYSFLTIDEQRGTIIHGFSAFEIDAAHKMKAGRKFNVVYIGSRPRYNRPDWVEELIAPTRWLTILGSAVAGIAFLAVALMSLFWLACGRPPKHVASSMPTRALRLLSRAGKQHETAVH